MAGSSQVMRTVASRLDLCAEAGIPNQRLAQIKLVRLAINKGQAQA